MKYIIFQFNDLYMPVIIPQHVTHKQVEIDGAHPISAGFFRFKKNGTITTYGESESLNLKPNLRDRELLQATLDNHGTYSFLIY